MPDAITLRSDVRESDLMEVRQILLSHGQFRDEEIAVAEELIEDRLTKHEKSEYFFVFADSEHRVEGFACYGPITITVSGFDLYWIAVRKDVYRTGIGAVIFQEVCRLSKLAGGTRIYAETSSDALHDSARRFYLKQGFIHHATVPDFYSLNDDKLIFGLTL